MDGISKILGGAIAALFAFGLTAASAQDCPRGDLDARFCDRDGDLLADPPQSERDWVNPSTLIFTYTPVEDPALYRRVWDDFMKHIENKTGRKVSYFSVHSYAAMVEAMRAGRLHIGGFATGSVPLGVNCAGFHPIATMGKDGRIWGYEMEIITYPGSGIEKIEDLRGRTLAFTTPASNSGFRAPSALLEAQFGLKPDRDFKTAFSGAHDNSVLGVANKDYDAAAIANEIMFRMFDRNVVKREQIKTIYTSATFPTTAYGYVYNLHPDLKAKVREAFMTYWGGELAKEFKDADGFVEIQYQKSHEIIRTIAKQIGEELKCS